MTATSFLITLTALFSFLPSLEETIVIEKWQYCGPFSLGAREGIIGIDQNIELNSFYTPDTCREYHSILVPGGQVRWRQLLAESEEVEISFDSISWDSLQDYYGIAGVLCGSYVFGEFSCLGKRRALIDAKGVSSFKLNGSICPADPYGDGFLQIPVVLDSGLNRVMIKLSGFTAHRFSFKVTPVNAPILIADDITKPDIIQDEQDSVLLGIPLVNTTDTWLVNVRLRITGGACDETVYEISKIAPRVAMKVPLCVNLKETAFFLEESLKFVLEVSFDDFVVDRDIWLMIKDGTEGYVRTFRSRMDNSCQYYAVLPPKNYEKSSAYGLIMTCHGAGVKAENQIKAYQQKEWAFVVAPTNRRRFGFDWQDWGRGDFLEVLEDVKEHFQIDGSRVYLTGHSMGGHGVWHIGTSHPDLFAAIAPSAGWTNFSLYVPWFLQKSEIIAHPDIIRFRDMVLREDNPLLFLENTCNLPMYILQGGADDNVPPVQARLFGHYLNLLDYDYSYQEIPGMGHWWDDDSTPAVDCVDSEELMQFLKNQRRIAHPIRVVCTTNNCGYARRFYWLEIEAPLRLYEEARLDASVMSFCIDEEWTHCSYTIDAQNTARFTVHDIQKNLLPNTRGIKSLEFIINGERILAKCNKKNSVSFTREKSEFTITDKTPQGCQKKPGLYGPIKQAYFNPFVLVYGTAGDHHSTAQNLNLARLQAYLWWYRANGFVEVFADTELTEEIMKNYNVILFGGPTTNIVVRKIQNKIPIQIHEEHVVVNKHSVKKKDLCLVHLYPNPLNQEKFVLFYAATSREAEKLMGFFTPLFSGSGLPDFIIYDASVLLYGWGGVIATGFYDREWRVREGLYYIKD
jgi:pimeloyl-ACP methyl ester carboxylesterase